MNAAATAAAIPRAPSGESATSRRAVSQRQTPRDGGGRAAIFCMTRWSSAGSIDTGRRKCRTTRSTASSNWSNMLGLPKDRLELFARTFHAHLQRRDPRAGELGDVLVLELLDVLEEKGFARFRREPRQRPAHHVVPLRLVRGSRERRGLERRGVVHEI